MKLPQAARVRPVPSTLIRAAGAAALVLTAGACAQLPAQEICRYQDPAALRLAAYSAAVSSRGLVFVSGVVPVVPETGKMVGADLEGQLHRAFANLERALALAGAGLDDVVKVTVYIKNPSDFPAMNRVYASHFGKLLPARTTVPGIDWGNGFLVEMDAVAVDRRRACDAR